MRLKIFSDQSYLSEGMVYEPILYPFWGKPQEKSNPYDPLGGCFDNYVRVAHSLFEMTSLEEADLAIVPCNCEKGGRKSLTVQFVEKAKQAGKPLVSFFGGACSHLELPFESNLAFRNSLYRSSRKATDFAYPHWNEDFVKKYLNNKLPIRQKRSKPVVGFCGFATKKNLKTYLKHFLYHGEKLFMNRKIPRYHIGHVLRFQALTILSKSPVIKTNIIERERVFFHESSVSRRKKLRAEFVQNMVESDYVLCCRGSGNASVRFCETLCCGRIPVFIDTDCVLPYDFEIDWKKYGIWVNESELPLIAEKIAEFHENLSRQEFVNLQYKCRRIWEQRLSPEGFFANLHRHIPIIKNSQELL